MTAPQPAETEVVITHLEMTARPARPRPGPPPRPLALLRAENPAAHYFLYLYRAVGAPYDWTDWLQRSEAEIRAFVQDPKVALYVPMVDGCPAGMAMLDYRAEGGCDLAYFGLIDGYAGGGLGGWLLGTAIHMGWDHPGVARMTVNTCTLDHPHALPLYQQWGFAPVRRESYVRKTGLWPARVF